MSSKVSVEVKGTTCIVVLTNGEQQQVHLALPLAPTSFHPRLSDVVIHHRISLHDARPAGPDVRLHSLISVEAGGGA